MELGCHTQLHFVVQIGEEDRQDAVGEKERQGGVKDQPKCAYECLFVGCNSDGNDTWSHSRHGPIRSGGQSRNELLYRGHG